MFLVPLIRLCLPIFLCALLFYVVNLAFENTATCYQLAFYRRRPSPSSLGSLKPSVGMCLLWDCVYNFQAIEVCWFLFFRSLYSLAPSIMSVVLQVSWHFNKPLSSPLFSVATQASRFYQYSD